MKKFICVLTAAALSAGLAVFGAGCGGNDNSKLSNGTLSASGYPSVTEAATACVTDEIAGQSTEATYKSYTAERILEKDEIQALNISEEQKAKVFRAEEGTIKYTVPDAEGNAQEFSTDIILINFGSEVCYYILDPENGENLTKSYFDKVNNIDCDNFTWSLTSSQTTSAGGNTIEQELSFDIKYTGTSFWFKTEMPDYINGSGATQTIELFAENEEDRIRTYTRINGGEFTTDTDADYSSLEELLNQSLLSSDATAQFDHTYYVKTDFGFSANDDKIMQIIDSIFAETVQSAEITCNEISFDFYVTDGMVTSSALNCDISVTVSGQTVSASMDMQMNITDIGTTTIEMPDKLAGLIIPKK